VDKTQFLSAGASSRLITEANIQFALPDASSELLDFICGDAIKVFMVVLFCCVSDDKLTSVMRFFQRFDFVDDILPITKDGVWIMEAFSHPV
jgi:hypothetical protein